MTYENNSHTNCVSLDDGRYKAGIEERKTWKEAVQEVLEERSELLSRLAKEQEKDVFTRGDNMSEKPKVDDLDKLEEQTEKLLDLLHNREKDLITWWDMVEEKVYLISQFLPENRDN